MGRIRAILILPLLVSSSFIVSSILKVPQYVGNLGWKLPPTINDNESSEDPARPAESNTSDASDTNPTTSIQENVSSLGRLDENGDDVDSGAPPSKQTPPSNHNEQSTTPLSHAARKPATLTRHERLQISTVPIKVKGANESSATSNGGDREQSVSSPEATGDERRTQLVQKKAMEHHRTQASRTDNKAPITNATHKATARHNTMLSNKQKQQLEHLPSIDSLAKDKYSKIVGDVRFLMHFSILGFPKTGTTTLADWINRHSETKMADYEMYALTEGRPAQAVHHLHRLIDKSNGTINYTLGFKCPYIIVNKGDSLYHLKRYWPDTRLIVGVRHPVKWYASFINFRLQGTNNRRPPTIKHLMGYCINLLCRKTAYFHLYLAGLGKTNSTSLRGLPPMNETYATQHAPVPPRMPNKVLLYDMEQLGDTNETRRVQFGRDVQEFLGLKAPMPPRIARKNEGTLKRSSNRTNYVDICNSEYDPLRSELMKASREASTWIRNYFLGATDVYVSSREYLEEILASWMLDPCDDDTSSS